MQSFVLGGGCFWCVDAIYQKTRGVTEVVSGYSGGHDRAPSYETVSSGITGHAEVVAVTFDETVIPANVILDMFFTAHDPTSLNRQGYDVGTQYRSVMFYANDEQKRLFKEAIDRNQLLWDDPIVTELTPLPDFYPAEQIHNDFYGQRPEVGYCQVIISPKLAKARQHYKEWLVA